MISLTPLLDIRNISVTVDTKTVLQDFSLQVNAGEVHVLMGLNGCGKSTLAAALACKPGYDITSGNVYFAGQDLSTMPAHERARLGLFLAFQYPIEIAGISNLEFFKAAHDQMRTAREQQPLATIDFIKHVRAIARSLEIDEKMLKRGINEGFSGGEKKRNEVMQMILLDPKLAIMDEIDSGLDIDALRIVAKGVNAQRDGNRSFLLITHYQRLLDYIDVDYVHVISAGQIKLSGDKQLALELEKKGYGWIDDSAPHI